MGATLSKNNDENMNRKEHLLEGKFINKDGKTIKGVEKQENNVREILRKYVKKQVEYITKNKLKNNAKYNHFSKISSVYDYDKDYVIKLDISIYGDYLDKGLDITKHVHRNSDIAPRIKEEASKVMDIIIDKDTSNKIIKEIENVEKLKRINLRHLKSVFKDGESIYCLVLVMEKLERTLEQTLNTIKDKSKLKKIENELKNLILKLNAIGVCHSDLNDNNFMIKNNKWYIIDFGDSEYINSNKKCRDMLVLERIFQEQMKENTKGKRKYI